jgi:hypothetical protein
MNKCKTRYDDLNLRSCILKFQENIFYIVDHDIFLLCLKNNIFFGIFSILRKCHFPFLLTLQLALEDMVAYGTNQLQIIPIHLLSVSLRKILLTTHRRKRHSMEEEVPNERWKMIGHCHHVHLWSWQVISFFSFLLKVIALDSYTL